MRIALICEQVDVARGGAETSTVEMARRLAELGLEVTVVHRGQRSAAKTPPGVRFLALPGPGPTRLRRTYGFLQAVNGLCRRPVFDVVHAVTPCLCAQVYQPRGGTYPEAIARSLAVPGRLPRVLRRWGRLFNMRQQFLRRIERRLLTHYSARVVVAAVSDYVRRQVVEGLGFPAAQVRLVFNGVDIQPAPPEARQSLRARLELSETSGLVLFVAHNFALKGLRELLRATAAARRRWTLVVAGRDAPQPYQRLAGRLGIADRVHFVGTDAPTAGWYAAADVLAHPTWYDPCSRVVLEALSLGLPVVTTRYNGAAEVLQPGRHGAVLNEPDDVPALAQAIERCLEPAVRAACAGDAEHLRGQLSMARHARELAVLYQDVLGRR